MTRDELLAERDAAVAELVAAVEATAQLFKRPEADRHRQLDAIATLANIPTWSDVANA